MKASRITTVAIATVAALGGISAPAFAHTNLDSRATSSATTSTTDPTAVTTATDQSTTDPGPTDPSILPPGGGNPAETFAHISCDLAVPHLGQIGTHANGLQYPGNITLHVERILTLGTKFAEEWENWPSTTSTGSWSVSTGYYSTMLHGTYKLTVKVYRDSDESFLGSDSATCVW